MDITINVFEFGLLILLWYAIKWGFRLLVLIFIGKILEGIKRKGAEKVNGLKQTFNQFTEGKQNENQSSN